ncbi:MAG TPA: zeta toxin family protein [Candidatus Saccharimonadales bacterium]|nr:zeta toxin family protein [Candidatus Saccharimonadales bacterium]
MEAMSTFDVVYRIIERDHPRLIYISGKTSTGKTTLANSLQGKYHTAIIELDKIILGIEAPKEINKFVAIYRNRDQVKLIELFVARVKQAVQEALKTHKSVIFEGAIANTKTLQKIVDAYPNDFLFIYLTPVSLEAYTERLTSRFVLATPHHNSGLPPSFWALFNEKELANFYTTRNITPEIHTHIITYAKASMEESEARLAMFKEAFHDILVLTV